MAVFYYHPILGTDGTVYSIDNLIVDWACKLQPETAFNQLCEIYSALVPDWNQTKQARYPLPSCSKYGFFVSSISGGGCFCYSGKWSHQDNGEWYEYPLFRLRFNPNKWFETPLLQAILGWIQQNCVPETGLLAKFDYAVDLPCVPSSVLVSSRKTGQSYEGTRYYGKRHHAGFLKCYDKQVESKLQTPLTRLEWTFCNNQPISVDSVVWLTSTPRSDFSSLSTHNQQLCRMAALLRAADAVPSGEYDAIFQKFDRRRQAVLRPYWYGDGVVFTDNVLSNLRPLLLYWCDLLEISFSVPSSSSFDAFSVGQIASALPSFPDADCDGGDCDGGDWEQLPI